MSGSGVTTGAVAALAALAFSLVLGLGATPAEADATTDAASRAIVRRNDALMRLLSRPASSARERALVRLADRTLDYASITERALVVHWAGLSRDDKREVSELLAGLIRHRYLAGMNDVRDYALEIVSAEHRGPDVRIESVARRGEEVRHIGYDVVVVGSDHRIVDLRVEGESLVGQYRTQFDRVIRRYGWDGFMARLRQRAADDEAEAT